MQDSGSLVEFSVLGTVSASDGRTAIDLGRRQERCLLGLLLLELGRGLPVERLADLLWDGTPPSTSRSVLQTYVARLRARLAPYHVDILRFTDIYRVDVSPDCVDLHRFQKQVADALAIDPVAARVEALRAALDDWAGPPLGDVATETLRRRIGMDAEELHLTAIVRCAEAEIASGDPAAAVERLVPVAVGSPVREHVVAVLMQAYAAVGRRTEAVDLFQRVRQELGATTGLDPSATLRRAYEQILKSPAGAHCPTLPRSGTVFVGRRSDLAALDRACEAGGQCGPLIVIAGPAGVGKTATALRWLRGQASSYPDGQIFVDMRGFAATAPTGPVEAMTRVLAALGVSPEQIPAEPGAIQDVYRSHTSERRLAILFDDVATVDQIRSALPAGRHTLAMVTSRRRLRGLAALDDATIIDLAPLAPADAVDLLACLHTRADQHALAELAQACGHIPLYLRIAAANAMTSGVAAFTASLRERGRLDAFEIEDDPLATARATLHLSYEALSGAAATLFRALGRVPCRSFTAEAAAALLDTRPAVGRRCLDQIVELHLAQLDEDRYTIHDLVREFAGEQARDVDPEAADAAIARLVEYYAASAASAAIAAGRDAHPRADNAWTPNFADADAAMAWLDQEIGNFVAVVQYAAEHDMAAHCWEVARSLAGYFWTRRPPHGWFAICETAMSAARRDGSAQGIASAANALAIAHWARHDIVTTTGLLEEALAALRTLGDRKRLAGVISNLGILARVRGDLATAAVLGEQSRRLARRAGRPVIEANALLELSGLQVDLGRLYPASRAARAAVAMYEKVGSLDGQVSAWNQFGEVAWNLGHYARAEHAIRHSLALAERIGSMHGRILARHALTPLLIDTGRAAEALAVAKENVDIAEDVDDTHLKDSADVSHAQALVATGRSDEAEPLLRKLIAAGGRESVLPRLIQANAHWRIGDVVWARRVAREGMELATSIGLSLSAARAELLLAEIAASSDDHATARDWAASALPRFVQAGAAPEIRRSQTILSTVTAAR